MPFGRWLDERLPDCDPATIAYKPADRLALGPLVDPYYQLKRPGSPGDTEQPIIRMQADLPALPSGWTCRFLPQTTMASDMLLSLLVTLLLEIPRPIHRPKTLKGGVFVIPGGRQRQQEVL